MLPHFNNNASVAADFEPTNTVTSSFENLLTPHKNSKNKSFVKYLKTQGVEPLNYFRKVQNHLKMQGLSTIEICKQKQLIQSVYKTVVAHDVK